jgi:dipeptidyl-peptidase-3
MAEISVKTNVGLNEIIGPLLAVPPFCLGYPSGNAQSDYYLSHEAITRDEIERVSEVTKQNSIGPENTRLRKTTTNDRKPVLQLLQASVDTDAPEHCHKELAEGVFLVRGDHSEELTKFCSALEKAKEYASNDQQTQFLTHYIESFRAGSLEAFQESQKVWVADVSARMENLIGFIEPDRGPAGIRCEWEAMVGTADVDEVKILKNSSTARPLLFDNSHGQSRV